jgi:hypothetical protein
VCTWDKRPPQVIDRRPNTMAQHPIYFPSLLTN